MERKMDEDDCSLYSFRRRKLYERRCHVILKSLEDKESQEFAKREEFVFSDFCSKIPSVKIRFAILLFFLLRFP